MDYLQELEQQLSQNKTFLQQIDKQLAEQNRIIEKMIEDFSTPSINNNNTFQFDAQVENGKGKFTHENVTYYGPYLPHFPLGFFRVNQQTYVLVNPEFIQLISKRFFDQGGKINRFRTRNHYRINLKNILQKFKQHLYEYFQIDVKRRCEYAISLQSIMKIIRTKDVDAIEPSIPSI